MSFARRLVFLTALVAGAVIATFNSCTRDEIVKAPLPENPQRIPCDACEPFAGYYELRDVSVNTINGTDIWSPLPVSRINGKIYGGYITLNTLSELVVYQTGEAYNSQTFTTYPYTFTLFYNYWIRNDSAMTVGPEHEPGSFFPHLGPDLDRIDTIIWDRCRYVRQ